MLRNPNAPKACIRDGATPMHSCDGCCNGVDVPLTLCGGSRHLKLDSEAR